MRSIQNRKCFSSYKGLIFLHASMHFSPLKSIFDSRQIGFPDDISNQVPTARRQDSA